MSNRQRGIVAVQLDVPRNIQFTISAQVEVETVCGGGDFYRYAVDPNTTNTRNLLWAGLRGADPSLRKGDTPLTLDAVTAMMEHANAAPMADIAISLKEAIIAQNNPELSEDIIKNVASALREAQRAQKQAILEALTGDIGNASDSASSDSPP